MRATSWCFTQKLYLIETETLGRGEGRMAEHTLEAQSSKQGSAFWIRKAFGESYSLELHKKPLLD